MTEVGMRSVFVGDLDIDEYERVRVCISSTYDHHTEELELELYGDQVTFSTYSGDEQVVRCTVSYQRLAQILSSEVLLQNHVEELNRS